jgi:hypothetical protein
MISRRHFLKFFGGLGALGVSTTAYGFRHPQGRAANPNSEYARHAVPQGLDPYGRSPARNVIDEKSTAMISRQATPISKYLAFAIGATK